MNDSFYFSMQKYWKIRFDMGKNNLKNTDFFRKTGKNNLKSRQNHRFLLSLHNNKAMPSKAMQGNAKQFIYQ